MDMIMPAEFEKQMKRLAESTDKEDRHIKADELMCKVLESLGYSVGVEIFRKMDNWYA